MDSNNKPPAKPVPGVIPDAIKPPLKARGIHAGIIMHNSSGATVENCKFINCSSAIHAENSHNTTVSDVVVTPRPKGTDGG